MILKWVSFSKYLAEIGLDSGDACIIWLCRKNSLHAVSVQQLNVALGYLFCCRTIVPFSIVAVHVRIPCRVETPFWNIWLLYLQDFEVCNEDSTLVAFSTSRIIVHEQRRNLTCLHVHLLARSSMQCQYDG
jgi:hypothetical protein